MTLLTGLLNVMLDVYPIADALVELEVMVAYELERLKAVARKPYCQASRLTLSSAVF